MNAKHTGASAVAKCIVRCASRERRTQWPGIALLAGFLLPCTAHCGAKNHALRLPPIDAKLASERFDPSTVEGTLGYFRVARSLTGHWWFQDPNGQPFFYRGVTSVSRGDDLQHTDVSGQDVLKQFGGDSAKYRDATFARLHAWGFNALGAWSSPELWDQEMPFTIILNLATPGPAIEGSDLPDVYDAEWQRSIDQVARRIVSPERSSRALVGYFTDNELDWSQPDSESQDEANEPLDSKRPPTLLQLCLGMKPGRPASEAAWKFVLSRHDESLQKVSSAWHILLEDRTTIGLLTSKGQAIRSVEYLADSTAFSEEFSARYFELTAAAIHRYDPNHLILGCRFGSLPGHAVLSQIRRPWVDVVSANNYWTTMQSRLNLYYRSTGLPVLNTEFSWGHPVFFTDHATADRAPEEMTDVQRMVGNGRQTLEDALRMPGLVGWTWYRWMDEPSFVSPMTYGLVNLKNDENVANTQLAREVNSCAEAIAVSGSCGGAEREFHTDPLDNRTSDGWRFHDGAPEALGGPPVLPGERADPEGFDGRRKLLLRSLASEDAMYFETTKKVPDPNKYAIPTMLAKLEEKTDEAGAYAYLARHTDELYPFGAVGLARLLPMFGKQLPDRTRTEMARAVANNSDWTAQGTENHKLMWLTSGVVLASQLPELTLYGGASDWRRRQLLEPIRLYVKRLYEAGQGEWDSSTYETFSIQGFLNLYDYSTDPHAKAVAAAALDWFATAMALHYFHGTMAGPERRGFDSGTLRSETALNAWLWWGDSARAAQPDDFIGPNARYGRYSIYAALSRYRPHPVLTGIARKLSPLAGHEIKPSYGMERSAESYTTLVTTDNYFLGSAEAGDAEIVQGANQWTPWKLVATGASENYVFTSLNPFYHLDEGRSPFDQVAQSQSTLIQMTSIPRGAEDSVDRLRTEVTHRPSGDNRFEGKVVEEARFRIPASLRFEETKGWFFLTAGKTWVAVRPLLPGATIEPASNGGTSTYLVSLGSITGFVVQVADLTQYATLVAFRDAVLEKVSVDVMDLSKGHVKLVALTGEKLEFHYNRGGAWPKFLVNGVEQPTDLSKVYDTPAVQQEGGRLVVHDSAAMGFEWDFTGDWPYYTELRDAK